MSSTPENRSATDTRDGPGAGTTTARDVDPVEVRDPGVSVKEARSDIGVRRARSRFGGIDVPATLVGMLAALALLALLAGLIGAAVGAIGYQTGLEGNADDLSIGGLVGGIAAILVAFVVGGWAAARIARYDGVRNGIMTAVWALVLAAIVAALAALFGSEYDILSRIDMPQWFSRDALTAGAIVSGAATVLAMLVGGAVGGWFGERYHKRVDAEIVSARPGAIATTRAGGR
jgi:hypothetical protein